MRWRACGVNVKKRSVNGGLLPTYSEIPPDLVRKKNFCTFADVEECCYSRPQRPREEGTSQTYTYIYIMAKSKSGGTRSYIRGKIGADVYSIGKDGKGAKQQVVRSLAEVVSNPQTQAQMKGRMIMSTVMQAVSALSTIIDHSFDGLPAGQPNISEFIKRNYQLIKRDVELHPSAGNRFGLVKYQEKGPQVGRFVVSDGKVIVPNLVVLILSNGTVTLSIPATVNVTTYGGLIEALGLEMGDMITVAGWNDDGALSFFRLKIKEGLTLTTVITSSNISDMFDIEASSTVSFTAGTSAISVSDLTSWKAAALIYSKKVGSGWQHNTASMEGSIPTNRTCDDVLPTYPTGQERFLNGGDI